MAGGRRWADRLLSRPKKSLQVNDLNPVISLQFILNPKIG